MSLTALLVLLAVALLAVAAFAPRTPRALAGVSLAPPVVDLPVERWSPPPFAGEPAEPVLAVARWPERIDPRASGCDAAARLALVDALATTRGRWAAEILVAARDDEPDHAVRAAIAAALDQVARM